MNRGAVIFLVLATALGGSATLNAIPQAVRGSPASDIERRLAQVGLDGRCFREICFEDVSLTEDRPLAVGIYEEYRDDRVVLDTQRVVLFGFERSPAWTSQVPPVSCDWELGQADPELPGPCANAETCRARWAWRRAPSGEESLEAVQLRTELRRPDAREKLQLPDLAGDQELWLLSLYPGGAKEPESSRVLLSYSGVESPCSEEVAVSLAERDGAGLDWSYRPLTGLEARSFRELDIQPDCFEVGSGGRSVFLQNDFVQAIALGRESKVVEQRFTDGEPWIFGRDEAASDEERLAANLFLHANRAVAGFGSIFPWLPELLESVKLRQVIGHSSKTCKARWPVQGVIEMPLDCHIRGGFRPKSLCGEVVTHELVHELASRLLSLTSGGQVQALKEKLLWEALADYLAVSLDEKGNGVYGILCGDDLRSIQDGLYQPELRRPTSFLEERRVYSSSFKSLLISAALFDLPAALADAVPRESKTPATILREPRRTVDRLALLSLLLGGQDWRAFLERLVDLTADLLPDLVAPVCSTLWDEHHLAVRGCAGRTRTTLFDLEEAVLAGDTLEVHGFVVGTAAGAGCVDPRLRVRIKGATLSQVDLATRGGSLIPLRHTVEVPAGTDPTEIEVSIEVSCTGARPLRQVATVNRAPWSGELELRAAAQNLLVGPGPADLPGSFYLAARDGSGGLTFVEAAIDFAAAEVEHLSTWIPAERIEEGSWRFEPPYLEATDLFGNRWRFSPEVRESMPAIFANREGAEHEPGDEMPEIELTEPPGLVLDPGQESEELISFRESTCRLPPSRIHGPGGAIAILTCDGFFKIRPEKGEWHEDRFHPSRFLVPMPLALADVDGDDEAEVIVGPLAEGWGTDALGELRAFEWNGEPVGGQWPIRAHLQPTAPAVFEDLDGDGCPEVILASDRVQVWNPSAGLPGCQGNGH